MQHVMTLACRRGVALVLLGSGLAAQEAWSDVDRDGVAEFARREGTQTVLYSGLTHAPLFRFEGRLEPDDLAAAAAPPPSPTIGPPLIGPVAPRKGGPRALVPNLSSNDVSILDTELNVEIARIPVADRPFKVAMTGDGRFGYVAQQSGGNVYKIDMIGLTLAKTFSVPTTSFVAEVEVSPDDRWLVLGETMRGTVHIVDATTDTLAGSLVLCQSCDGVTAGILSTPQVAFSPSSQIAYVSIAQSDETLYAIELATQSIVASGPTQPTGGTPITDLELTSDGKFLYMAETFCLGGICDYREVDVTTAAFQDIPVNPANPAPDVQLVLNEARIASGGLCYGGCGNSLDILDRGTQLVTPIPTETESNRNLVYEEARQRIWGICIPAFIYCNPGKVDVFDLITQQKVTTIDEAVFFGNTALSQDGKSFYAIDPFDRILVIDTATFAVSHIDVGSNPRGVFLQGDNRVKFLSN